MVSIPLPHVHEGWVGDRIYDFADGKVVVGMTQVLFTIFPFLDSVWFWTPLYWIVRLIWIGAFLYVLIYLPCSALSNWAKQRSITKTSKAKGKKDRKT